jgi:tetratricopeptide (TPR) repeat protein
MKKIIIVFIIILFVFNTSYIAFAQQDSTVEKLLEEGKQAYMNGNFKLAVDKLSTAITIIKNKKDLLEAYITLSLTYYTLGDNQKARNTIIKALQVKPNLLLNTEVYSPKFIVFLEDTKKEVMRELKFNIKPSAKLYIDDLYYGENSEFTVKLVKGEHKIKVEQKAYKTYEKMMKVLDSNPIQNIILEKLIPAIGKTNKKEKVKKEKTVEKRKEQTSGKIEKEKKKKGGSKLLYYIGGLVLGAVVIAALTKKKTEEGEKFATIKINSVPESADVFLDGQETGKTTPCVLNNITEGTHDIKIAKELYGVYTKQVSVSAGQTLEINSEIPPFKYEYIMSWGSLGVGDRAFKNPISISLYNNDTRVLVVDNGNMAVKIFGTVGAYIGKIISNLSNPIDVYGLDNDRIFVTDPDYNGVLRYNINGGYLDFFGGKGTGNGKFNAPFGITADCDKNVYVVDAQNRRIQVFDKNGVFIRKWGKQGNGDGDFDFPVDVSVNEFNGDVYVTDYGLNKVVVYSKEGNYLFKWGAEGSGKENFKTPFSIATDRIGNVYVADMGNNRVVKYTEKGHYAVKINVGAGSGRAEFIKPYGVAVDKDGKVYVVDTGNNRIQKFRLSDKTTNNGFAVIKVVSDVRKNNYNKVLIKRRGGIGKISIDLRKRIKRKKRINKER